MGSPMSRPATADGSARGGELALAIAELPQEAVGKPALMSQAMAGNSFVVAKMDEVCRVADDLMFAEDLQLEEVIRFSAHSAGPNCAVCGQATPSVDASWKPDNCDHVMCITCFGQLASDSHAAELPKCPLASCQSSPDISVSNEEKGGGKGKELATYVVLVERGKCSRGAAATASSSVSSEFYCTICMETVDAIERFDIPGCTHAFCASCVRQYIAAKVEENVLSIGCPDPVCKDNGGPLHPEACRDVIPPQLFQRWGDALCYLALSSLKFYCPFSDCSALLVDDPGDGEEAITNAECPHCSRMFCAQCRVPWHDGATCAEFQKLGKDERGQDDLLLRKVAQDSKWQRCPKCKMYVERVEGCVWALLLLPLRIANVEGQPSLQEMQANVVLPGMENKCVDVDAMIIDNALAEELQVQEAILFSAFQEMTIQYTDDDDSIDHPILIGQDQGQESKRPFSVADHGEPSSSSLTKKTTTGGASIGEFYCSICMETVPGALKFIVSSCRHAFCKCCIGQYVAAKIGENTAHVRCPDPGCCDGGVVEPESCRGVVPSEVLDRWGFLLCEAAIVARKLHCPFPDCSEPLLADADADGEGGGDRVAEAECPSCHRLFCARCMVPWHDGVGCEEFQELGEDERGREDVMVRRLAGRERWQRCPQCRTYVEKSEGCMFMKCRNVKI
uniref:RBR-type E3 ubiquitin transferase n=1 Tax=Oryza punctata TaxID=4537 RepID=A0A0E0M1A9_ORYPU